jgi:hypothetical protein
LPSAHPEKKVGWRIRKDPHPAGSAFRAGNKASREAETGALFISLFVYSISIDCERGIFWGSNWVSRSLPFKKNQVKTRSWASIEISWNEVLFLEFISEK